MKKKIYIAGKVTGEQPYYLNYKFGYTASKLKREGYIVINPVEMFDSMEPGFEYKDILTMCFAAISVCDAVYMLRDWKDSKGAKMEHEYALEKRKEIIYQEPTNE